MGSDHHKKHKKDKKKKKKRKHHDSQGTDEEETVTSEPKIELPQSNKGNEKFITRFFFLSAAALQSSYTESCSSKVKRTY